MRFIVREIEENEVPEMTEALATKQELQRDSLAHRRSEGERLA